MDDIIFLVTEDKKQIGTATITDYSGIFIKSNNTKYLDILNQTEIDAFEIIADDINKNIKVRGVRCGCVYGYPSTMFSKLDCSFLKDYGLNHRFQF